MLEALLAAVKEAPWQIGGTDYHAKKNMLPVETCVHILVLSSVELTSTPPYRLTVTALLSSGCRATVESLSSVHSSSTVAELPCWVPIACAVSANFKAFSFLVIKVIRLFCYCAILYSASYSVPDSECHLPQMLRFCGYWKKFFPQTTHIPASLCLYHLAFFYN